ncbi:MAG: SMC-Scp complex subunit ScpB [Sedimentisphaerales bacterium]|nr:SMC-Scp complex subunit ScpB [Sedimentisphaerales bacterium]
MGDDNNIDISQQQEEPASESAQELSAAFCQAINEDTGDSLADNENAGDSITDSDQQTNQSDSELTQVTPDEEAAANLEPEPVIDPELSADQSNDHAGDTPGQTSELPDTQSDPDLNADNGDQSAPPTNSDDIPGNSGQQEPQRDLFGEVIDDDTDTTEPDDDDIPEQEITTCSVVEAILFAADEPVNVRKIVEIIDAGGVKEVKKHIRDLNRRYKKMGCAFRVEELAGGYQLLTQSAYNPWLSKLIKVRSEGKLSSAAMETLAIIAYKQPLMRVEIENIRGVAAGEMIRQLIEKGLVKITGRAEELGRPLLYGTTQKFLDVFGLASIKDLPQPDSAPKKQ